MSKYLLSEKEYTEYQNIKARLKELKEENETLKENIKIIFTSLIIANHVDVGAIQDTIWVNDYVTLWDYIRNVLDMDDEQFEKFEEQALQNIRKVDNG